MRRWGLYGQPGSDNQTYSGDHLFFGSQSMRSRNNVPGDSSFEIVYGGSQVITYVEFYVGTKSVYGPNNASQSIEFYVNGSSSPTTTWYSNVTGHPDDIPGTYVFFRQKVAVPSYSSGPLSLKWKINQYVGNPYTIIDNIRLYYGTSVPPDVPEDPYALAAKLDANPPLLPIYKNRDRQIQRMSWMAELDKHFHHYKETYWDLGNYGPVLTYNPSETVDFPQFLQDRQIDVLDRLSDLIVEPDTIAVAKTYSSGYLLKFSDGTILASDFAGGPTNDITLHGFEQGIAAGLSANLRDKFLEVMDKCNGITISSHHHADHNAFKLLEECQQLNALGQPRDIKIIGPRTGSTSDPVDMIEIFDCTQNFFPNYYANLLGLVPNASNTPVPATGAAPVYSIPGRSGFSTAIFVGAQGGGASSGTLTCTPMGEPMNYCFVFKTPDGFQIAFPGEQTSPSDFLVPGPYSNTFFERAQAAGMGVDLIVGTPSLSTTSTFDSAMKTLFGAQLRLLGHEWELKHWNELSKRCTFHDRFTTAGVDSQGSAVSVGEIFVYRRFIESPHLTALGTTSATIAFKTSLPVKSRVKYWDIDALESTALYTSWTAEIDDHSHTIMGLTAGLTYNYKVESENGQASSPRVFRFGTYNTTAGYVLSPAYSSPSGALALTNGQSADTTTINRALVNASICVTDGLATTQTVTLSAGSYFLSAVSPALPRSAAVYFPNLSGVIFEGATGGSGARLFVCDVADGILVEDGQNITIRNITIDTDADPTNIAVQEPPFVEGRVLGWDGVAGYPDSDGPGDFYYVEVPKAGFVNPQTGLQMSGSRKCGFAAFSPETFKFKKKGKELPVAGIQVVSQTATHWTIELDMDGRQSPTGSSGGDVSINDLCYVAQKDTPAGNALRCDGASTTNLHLENITVESCWRGAFSLYQTVGFSMQGCRVIPRSGRLLSANRDGIYLVNAMSSPSISNTEISRCGDDGMNLHTQVGVIEAVTAVTGGYLIRYSGKLEDHVGHTFEFFDYTATSSAIDLVSFNRTSLANRIGDPIYDTTTSRWTIVVDAVPTSSSFGVGDLFWSPEMAADGFSVNGCTVRDNRGRGMVIRGSNGSVTNNLIEGSMYQGIVLGPEIAVSSTKEAGFIRNVTVSGNTIRNTGFSNAVQWTKNTYPGAISLTWMSFHSTLTGSTFPWPTCREHDDVTITDNTIETVGMIGIFVSNADNVVVSNNRLRRVQLASYATVGSQVGLPTSTYAPNSGLYFHQVNDASVHNNAAEKFVVSALERHSSVTGTWDYSEGDIIRYTGFERYEGWPFDYMSITGNPFNPSASPADTFDDLDGLDNGIWTGGALAQPRAAAGYSRPPYMLDQWSLFDSTLGVPMRGTQTAFTSVATAAIYVPVGSGSSLGMTTGLSISSNPTSLSLGLAASALFDGTSTFDHWTLSFWWFNSTTLQFEAASATTFDNTSTNFPNAGQTYDKTGIALTVPTFTADFLLLVRTTVVGTNPVITALDGLEITY